MSKSPESNEAIDQEKRKQELEQQLKEEYQNLTYTQALWAFSPFETGNKKYDDLNKKYLTLTNNNLGIVDNFTNAITNTFGGGINAVIEAKKLVDDVQALKAAKKAGDKQNTVDATLKTIKDVGPIAQNLSSILHSGVISDASKDAILQYAFTPYILTPLLNKKLTKVTKNFQTSELEKYNGLKKLNKKIVRFAW